MIPSLAVLLDELAASEDDITATPVDGLTTWSRAGRAFFAAGASGVEFRLERAIAAAASRTPDAGPSSRGPEWVRFNPRELDGHAVDRVTAWFELAYRLGGE
ncbi:MAG TPA: hypothetical protein VJ850_02850 [Candidatus Limnocylindrales bacterium]|nr:hypothetical protein [Candidatus Limnocylindrales bacterium]